MADSWGRLLRKTDLIGKGRGSRGIRARGSWAYEEGGVGGLVYWRVARLGTGARGCGRL